VSAAPLVVDDGAREPLDVVDDIVEIVRLVERQPAVFIRYSEGPDRDGERPSMDYESGLPLPGLSVTVLNPPSWWTRPATDWVARRICKYAELLQGPGDRRPWLLTGRMVDTGPDHEPLVVEARPLAWIGSTALAQAVEIYRRRFDVARDSRG
jgi:hypothetical protein